MESLEKSNCWLMAGSSVTRTQAFEKCAWCSWKMGYTLFGLDGNKSCSSGMITLASSNSQDRRTKTKIFKVILENVSFFHQECMTKLVPARHTYLLALNFGFECFASIVFLQT